MKRNRFLILVIAIGVSQMASRAMAQAPVTGTAKHIAIILKLDDFGSNASFRSAETLDFLVDKKIKAGLGFIAGRLDSNALAVYGKYLDKTDAQGAHLFEVWNHGLFHTNNNPPDNNAEFKGTGYEFQKTSFTLADEFVKAYLKVQMHSFGAPFNAVDSITGVVISENKNYKVYLFGSEATPEGIMNLSHRVDMEIVPGNINYDHFVKQYNLYKKKYNDYMVLQGHPNQWDSNKIQEFKKILAFLSGQGCTFTLPYEYYLNHTGR